MSEQIEIFRFPDGFLWGTAVAPQQNEGGNWNSDWWELEYAPKSPLKDKNGDATDFYHLYKEDIKKLAQLGFNALRFGLAWERIEPEDGQFSNSEMDHYVDVIKTCKENGIEPIVTINHFSLPRWVGHHGGFYWKEAPQKFKRFVEYVIPHIKDGVKFVLSLNEPDLETNFGFRWGFFPGGVWTRSQGIDPTVAADQVMDNLIEAHAKGREVVRRLAPEMRYGWSLSTNVIEPSPGNESLAEEFRSLWQDAFYAATKGDDFVGIQPYTRWIIGKDEQAQNDGVLRVNLTDYPKSARITGGGLEFYPEVVYEMSRYIYSKVGLPILITENGIGTPDDKERQEYIALAVANMALAMEQGIPILGYLHWSFIDNWEWAEGYSAHFGLLENDRLTQTRTERPSAKVLGGIAKSNSVKRPAAGKGPAS